MSYNPKQKRLDRRYFQGEYVYNYGGYVPPIITENPVSTPFWVVGGTGTNELGYSTDGITWSASTNGNSIFGSSVRGVAWNGSLWVAGGQATNRLGYSTDGITWSASTNGDSVITTTAISVASKPAPNLYPPRL